MVGMSKHGGLKNRKVVTNDANTKVCLHEGRGAGGKSLYVIKGMSVQYRF